MRGGSGWSSVKPILKALQDWCAGGNGNHVYAVYVVKPDNFWHKQRTSMASHKYKFEVINFINFNISFKQICDVIHECFLDNDG